MRINTITPGIYQINPNLQLPLELLFDGKVKKKLTDSFIFINDSFKTVEINTTEMIPIEKITNKVVQLVNDLTSKQSLPKRILLLPQKESNRNQIVYLIPMIFKKYIVNDPILSQIISNTYFYDTFIDIRALNKGNKYKAAFKFINKFLNYANPTKIIISDNPQDSFRKSLVHNTKIIYIHHGMFVEQTQRSKATIKDRWSPNINYMISNLHGVKWLKEAGKKHITKINGLPQIDYATQKMNHMEKYRIDFQRGQKIKDNIKIILIITRESYGNIINKLDALLVKNNISAFLIIKHRGVRNYPYKLKSKHKIYYSDITFYDYLFADLIMILDEGTSTIECLHLCPLKTMIYRTTLETMQYHLLPFNVAKNLDDLEKKMIKIFEGLEHKDKIIHETQNFIKSLIGGTLTPISDDIIEKALELKNINI